MKKGSMARMSSRLIEFRIYSRVNIKRKFTVNQGSDAEFGLSLKNRTETQYFEDLDTFDWYAYDDNFGTDEEKCWSELLRNWYRI